MNPERWRQIEEVFQAALDLPEAERASYVEGACAGDEGLRREVERLLAQYESAGAFIDEPVYERTGMSGFSVLGALDATRGETMAGRRVGAYRVIREIGRGGMGAVYLAERDDNVFRRRVAVKLIKRGMDTDFILRRFRHERRILASLDHPNIARLLDGGSTDDGRPYFVMEYIEGEPFYAYCDRRRLDVAGRLRLFCRVCEAVEYAHQSRVIHRDLKPSNVLVTKDGTPKLFDFGIGKLLDPELAADSAPLTATSVRMMTVEYASPEQVTGQAVNFTSDVYSLGVILYELLTGRRPYGFASRQPQEVVRVIAEQVPERPSAAVGREGNLVPCADAGAEADAVARLAAVRADTPEGLRRALSGDLDNVVMKALRKAPSERYGSAAALREDILRHLEGRPVSAPFYVVSPAAGDPARAFEQREAEAKSIAVLPLKLIDPSAGEGTGDDYLRVGLADALITRLSNMRRFVVRPTSSILPYGEGEPDPFAAGRALGVDYVVDGHIRRVGQRIRVTAQLLGVNDNSTRWAQAFYAGSSGVLELEDSISEQVVKSLLPHLTGEDEGRLRKRGTDDPEAFESYLRGRHHWNTFTEEGFAEALACYNHAAALDPDYALAYAGMADYYNWLGVYLVRPFAEASYAAKGAALRAVTLDPSLAEGYSALGFAVVAHDFDFREAEAHHRLAIELKPTYATAHHWYSFHLQMEGRFAEALSEAERALQLDPLSPNVLQVVGWCHYNARRFADAIAVYDRLLAAEPRFAYALLTYSWILRHVGRHDEAVAAARKSLDFGGEAVFMLSGLGAAYAAAGRRAEAEGVLRRLEEVSAAGRYVSPYHLALVHNHLGDAGRALSLLERAHEARDGWLVWLGVEPQLDPLRREPRFARLLAAVSRKH